MGIIEYIYQQWSSITTRLSTCIFVSTGKELVSRPTLTNPPRRQRDIRSERLRLPRVSQDPPTLSALLCLRLLAAMLKVRLGRGFTLTELKAAGLTRMHAKTVGISVDHRRTSTSEEQLQMNVARLNEYKSKMILFPKRMEKPKKGAIPDATAEKVKAALAANQSTGITMPIQKKVQELEFAKITDEDKKIKVFHGLRSMRTNTRYNGRRIKKAADAKKAKE